MCLCVDLRFLIDIYTIWLLIEVKIKPLFMLVLLIHFFPAVCVCLNFFLSSCMDKSHDQIMVECKGPKCPSINKSLVIL